MSEMSDNEQPKTLLLGPLFLCFGALCLLTAFVLTFIGGGQTHRMTVPAKGGETKPFEITQANTVLNIEVTQDLPLEAWSDVSVSLTDADDKTLVGMTGGFWHESGYDDGEYWNQADKQYSGRLVVHEPGMYQLDVEVEDNQDAQTMAAHPIAVVVQEGGYSYIPHFVLGLLALLVGVILTYVHGATLERKFLAGGV